MSIQLCTLVEGKMSKIVSAKARIILVVISIAMFVLGAGAPGMGGEIIDKSLKISKVFGF